MKNAIIPLVLFLGFIATAVFLLFSVHSERAWYFALGFGLAFSVLGCAALERCEEHEHGPWRRHKHGH